MSTWRGLRTKDSTSAFSDTTWACAFIPLPPGYVSFGRFVDGGLGDMHSTMSSLATRQPRSDRAIEPGNGVPAHKFDSDVSSPISPGGLRFALHAEANPTTESDDAEPQG